MTKAKTASGKVALDLDTPTDLSQEGVNKISAAMNTILADTFALYLKTKNFHWHVSGRHFRDYHLLLDEQSAQIFASTDEIAERVRKIGGATLRSIGQVAKLQTLEDNDENYVPPREMLRELMNDNKKVVASMRNARTRRRRAVPWRGRARCPAPHARWRDNADSRRCRCATDRPSRWRQTNSRRCVPARCQ